MTSTTLYAQSVAAWNAGLYRLASSYHFEAQIAEIRESGAEVPVSLFFAEISETPTLTNQTERKLTV